MDLKRKTLTTLSILVIIAAALGLAGCSSAKTSSSGTVVPPPSTGRSPKTTATIDLPGPPSNSGSTPSEAGRGKPEARQYSSGNATAPEPAAHTITARAGTVEVSATYLSPGYLAKEKNPTPGHSPDRELLFFIALTTHSGDLTSYQFLQNARLRVGDTEYRPLEWEFSIKDAHHPQGVLVFPKWGEEGGPPIIARSMTLVLRKLGGKAETILTWQLQ